MYRSSSPSPFKGITNFSISEDNNSESEDLESTKKFQGSPIKRVNFSDL